MEEKEVKIVHQEYPDNYLYIKNKPTLLLITGISDKQMRININEIESYYRGNWKSEKCTILQMISGRKYYVRETVEELDKHFFQQDKD